MAIKARTNRAMTDLRDLFRMCIPCVTAVNGVQGILDQQSRVITCCLRLWLIRWIDPGRSVVKPLAERRSVKHSFHVWLEHVNGWNSDVDSKSIAGGFKVNFRK
ncbi:hypothetical protein ACFVOR_25910 [Streptomyces sp. NPDC057837]|uniref:hypothetical protein n=1 Tax=unclassified Streptomyces TaxID=2593676 RepID=UPI0036AB1B9B